MPMTLPFLRIESWTQGTVAAVAIPTSNALAHSIQAHPLQARDFACIVRTFSAFGNTTSSDKVPQQPLSTHTARTACAVGCGEARIDLQQPIAC